MNAYWQFMLSALQDQFGKELGQLIAWLFCITVVLLIVTPLYMIMKSATQLGSGRANDMGVSPGMHNPVVLSEPISDPFPSVRVASYPATMAPSDALERQSLADASSSNNGQVSGLAASRYVGLAVFAMVVAGALFTRITNRTNVLVLLPTVLIAFAFIMLRQVLALKVRPSSITIKRTVTVKEPLVVRLDKDAIQKARILMSTGRDLESVCREIEPGYQNWGFAQQQGFRKAMETLLENK
jgi:hypothetical protein